MFHFTGYRSARPMCSTWSDWILLQPGFPNRKSPDQSVFAAPRSFSQLVTSFIAWCRQGIHLLLLPICFISLTTLQMNEVWSGACITHKRSSTVKEHRFPKRNQNLKSSRPGASLSGDAACFPANPAYATGGWWAQVDLNHRPRAYQARALTS